MSPPELPPNMVKGKPVEPAYSGPPGAWYDASHIGEIAKGSAETIQANPFKAFTDYLFTPGAPGQIPPGRVAVVWMVIIIIGLIGVSSLLKGGTTVVIGTSKGKK